MPPVPLVPPVPTVLLCIAAFCAYRVGVQTERTNVQKQSADHVKLIRVPKNFFSHFLNSRLTLFGMVLKEKCLIKCHLLQASASTL